MEQTRFPQGILVSCEIPWDEHEELIEDLFRDEVRRAVGNGFRNLYVFGTAGEGHAVDTRRFRQAVQVFAEETRNPELMPQIGVIALSTMQFHERLGIAYDAGFRMFQISLPSWGALTDREVLAFFHDVCGAFPDARFLHYNLARAKRMLTADDYRRLIGAIPNLVATKNTGLTPRGITEMLRKAGALQHFVAEDQFAIGCLTGECSLLSSSGKAFPAKARRFFELGVTKQFDQLFPMLAGYHKAIDEILLEPAAGLNLMDGAYDKAMVRLSTPEFPLRLLSPYSAMPDDVFETCRRTLIERYHDWLEP
ncbi:MAG: dihydrodipicolinate synthase family protein [Bryobacterales bacterium]|nr:dihydrodipicolinate synthase family protein [Bryobacterales bacterium]